MSNVTIKIWGIKIMETAKTSSATGAEADPAGAGGTGAATCRGPTASGPGVLEGLRRLRPARFPCRPPARGLVASRRVRSCPAALGGWASVPRA